VHRVGRSVDLRHSHPETPATEIERAVVHAKATLATNLRPPECSLGRIAVRFGAVSGLRGAEAIEYDALSKEVLNIIRRGDAPVWMGKTPLQVDVASSRGGFTFRLADPSRRRALAVKGVSLPIGVVRLDHDTYDEFERLYGDLMMHILPTVTGMTLDRLRSEGGVILTQPDVGRIIWEWPRRTENS